MKKITKLTPSFKQPLTAPLLGEVIKARRTQRKRCKSLLKQADEIISVLL